MRSFFGITLSLMATFRFFGSPADFNNGNANVWNENENLNNNNVNNNNAVRPDSY